MRRLSPSRLKKGPSPLIHHRWYSYLVMNQFRKSRGKHARRNFSMHRNIAVFNQGFRQLVSRVRVKVAKGLLTSTSARPYR